jgi:hypothetical protein
MNRFKAALKTLIGPKLDRSVLPTQGGRRSAPNEATQPWDKNLKLDNGRYRTVTKPFLDEYIPLIRALAMMNPDVSQAIWNIVSLANTGHKIYFDRNVPEDMVSKMRNHIINRRQEWMAGQAGRDGMVNKMFHQLLIGGALSNEWVPRQDLSGVEAAVLINPEDIEFVLRPDGITYEPYQRPRNWRFAGNITKDKLIKLNPATYKYFALNGDTEIPYGIPPYIAAIEDIHTQWLMKKNIRHVVDQFGLISFLQVLLGKPDQLVGESDDNYRARLEALMDDTKKRMYDGMREGVVVGFQGDAEFESGTIHKSYAEAIELFKNNESQIASGMKQDPTLWGRDYNTSETQITVVFMKMLSEMRFMQNIVGTNLQFGYTMELALAGYKFDYLTVQFKPSTLGDDLKLQQAEEIKIRNVERKRLWGIISQEQMADELGYEAPDQDEPVVDINTLAGGKSAEELQIQKEKREAGKDASDKKVRKKNKPTGGKDK